MLLRRMRMRRVVVVGQVEDLAPRRNVKHGDRILCAPNEDHIIVFGDNGESAPELEKVIIKENGRQIFIYKRQKEK